MTTLKRRALLGASMATMAAPQIMAQSKPEKLVYVGDNGPWHWVMVEEVAPAFEKATGIKIDFTLLPVDPWRARLRAELGAGSAGIDVVQWSVGMAGWISPHMEDHEPLLAQMKSRHADFDWDDYLTGTKKAATYDGKLSGIPYRITTGIFHYQKALLEQAGFSQPPGTWDEFLKVALAVNKPPDRYAFGIFGRQGAGMFVGFNPWLYSNGGRLLDFKTGEIFINDAKGVEALQFYADLVTKYKVVPPEAMTWEFDEIVAGGQNDRYAMTITLAPYGTLINDPKLSKTAGKWAWAVAPGAHGRDESRVSVGGWTFGVPSACKHKDWAFEFIQTACSKDWMRRSVVRGNAPPRVSVLNHPDVQEHYGWAPVLAEAMKTATLEPREPIWPTMELSLRTAISAVLLGQNNAKDALDAVAADWQRALRRAGLKG